MYINEVRILYPRQPIFRLFLFRASCVVFLPSCFDGILLPLYPTGSVHNTHFILYEYTTVIQFFFDYFGQVVLLCLYFCCGCMSNGPCCAILSISLSTHTCITWLYFPLSLQLSPGGGWDGGRCEGVVGRECGAEEVVGRDGDNSG